MPNLPQTLPYDNIRLEGGLFVPDLLERAAQGRGEHQTVADYRIPKGTQLHDEYGRAFKIARAQWKEFAATMARSDINQNELAQRTRAFMHEFLRDVLGYDDITASHGIDIDAHHYPIAFLAADARIPVVVAPAMQALTVPDECFAVTGGSARRKSPVQLMQDVLNASKDHTWGLVTNGRSLRLLHDSATLTRPCYLEVDLEAILRDDIYHEFKAVWLLLHASRAFPVKDADCVWEGWRKSGHAEGIRVRDGLRKGVTDSLLALGGGFLQHKANAALRQALDDGTLTRRAYFEQLLRLVYRFIFLFTTEERGILHPDDDSPEGAAARALYADGYAMRRLSQRALRQHGFDDYHDLWQGIQIVVRSLRAGQPRLALPALGGLFAGDQCPDLDGCLLTNRVVLTVMRNLRWAEIQGALTRVDYRNMGPEELGSVYESLLELEPEVDVTLRAFTFIGLEDDASTAGNKRKTTGSYYTPDSLVQELIRSALDPVIEKCLAEHADAPVQALLNLAVIDPACGSGHFLLSAARRLAEKLAPLRSTDGAVHDEDYRVALRDVVSHCIYGVDRNPLALELARTALWLEGFEPGRPLSFLDHHLVCGDALLGVLDFEQLRNGIPKDAYQMLAGDDRQVCTDLTRINTAQLKALKAALKGEKQLFEQEEREDIFKQMAHLDTLPDNTPADISAKAQAYTAFLNAAHDSHLAHAADLFVGAFLVPKDKRTAATVPTTEALQYELTGSGKAATSEMRAEVSEACRQARVLHWPLAFAHVFARGGFDCVLGNPPWERIKLQEQEFFATRVPKIAEAKNKAERAKRIAWLSEGILASNLNPDAYSGTTVSDAEKREYSAFIIEKRLAEALSVFAHLPGEDGGRFPLTGTGDVNTYALFAETMRHLLSKAARAGFIVQSGIATDDSTKRFFSSLVDEHVLVSLIGFDNAELIFPAVHPDTPFCLVTLGTCTGEIQLCHYILRIEHLADVRRWFQLAAADFELLNPNTKTCPVFRSQMDAELTRKIYHNVPVLIREGTEDQPEDNPWGISFLRMLDMSNDSHLFVDSEQVPQSKISNPKSAIPKIPNLLPLYEAKMIHQFDHRWATYRFDDDKESTVDVSLAQKQNPDYAVRPRYFVEERHVLARIANVPSAFANAYAAEDMTGLLVALANWIQASEADDKAGAPIPYDRQLTLLSSGNEQLGLFGSRRDPVTKRYPILTANADGVELPTEWMDPKALVNASSCKLSDSELAQLQHSKDMERLADTLMDCRSPEWLMGWRRNARSNDERTSIIGLIPRCAVGDSLFLIHTATSGAKQAALLGCLNSLVFDFVARQKVGGVNFSYYYMEQQPVLPPDRYTEADHAFITPRVLELTYTTHDLKPWAEALGYDGEPFVFDPDRRARLRAELDAYYARLYGLTRDDLRYILDPADIMGPDYPSETFRVLKNNEQKAHNEYRTQRLVFEAWDAQEAALSRPARTVSVA